MNSSDLLINESARVLEQLESFDNRDLVNVLSYLVMSISKFILFIIYFTQLSTIIVGIMTNSWILILAGRQSRRQDIR